MQRFFGTQNLRRLNSIGSKSKSHVTDALIGRLTAPPTGSFAYVRPRQMSRWRWWASAFFLGHPMIDEPSCDSWRYSFHLLGHVTLSNQWQPSAVDLNFCAPNEGGSVNRCRQVEKQTFQEAPCDFQTLNTFRSSSGGMFKTTKVPPVGLDV